MMQPSSSQILPRLFRLSSNYNKILRYPKYYGTGVQNYPHSYMRISRQHSSLLSSNLNLLSNSNLLSSSKWFSLPPCRFLLNWMVKEAPPSTHQKILRKNRPIADQLLKGRGSLTPKQWGWTKRKAMEAGVDGGEFEALVLLYCTDVSFLFLFSFFTDIYFVKVIQHPR